MTSVKLEEQDGDMKGIVKSDIPEICKAEKAPVMLGIDEAGRGPILGPMVYGASYWRIEDDNEISKQGYDDSKALSSDAREGLFRKIKQDRQVGWVIRVISAKEISGHMLSQTSNLNEISRNAAIQMIRLVRDAGVNVKHVYVDTVGDPQWYENFLTRKFNDTIKFTVRKKADSLFKVVSAASICAKVTRDEMLHSWEWEEAKLELSKTFGSGYPSDPKTKEWLEKNIDNVFGYPTLVRFSWKTLDPLFEKIASVKWHSDKQREQESSNTQSIAQFMKTPAAPTGKRQKRSTFFQRRGLVHCTDL